MPSSLPADLEPRIRRAGAVLDLALAHSLYQPLLETQPRDGVTVVRDVAYGADARHRLDLYQPQTGNTPPRAVLIFFHGGGFVRGDKSGRDNIGLYYARAGYLVIVPNYRLAPRHTWPAGAEDVISAYEWAHRHVAQYGGDAQRIFLAGESAGAAHVALATLVRRFHPADGLNIAGAILISGVYHAHLENLARAQFGIATPDPRNEAYFGSDFSRYAQMSTVELIDAAPVPLLITYAELDLLQMQVQAGELFARLVTQHGHAPQLRVISGHNHLTQVYAVNTGDESLSRPILEFMQQQDSTPAAGR